ncbi:succinylglutamate desuccinylase/aspartoacylase family protein [Streptomyces sp. NPDC045431]|uniref:succinylglutamate desuccinylase/aspartoacylase family protein n=1 Tax=Streptomyces sp. NPDC045431 TaxID=3155613 RepID=UPI0033E917BE
MTPPPSPPPPTPSVWALGPLRAQPGTKARGLVPADLAAVTADIPVTLVNGARPGPRVVITAGMHGGEFTGIDAAARLAALLAPEEVTGQVLVCPVANPPAVYHGRLGVSPLDGVNINRVFPGDARGGPTERLAAWHTTHLITGADVYVDLHSGGIDETLRDFVGYRLTGEPGLDARTRALARALGVEDVILGRDTSGGNSHAAAARRGVAAVLVETGRLGERDPATAHRLVDGLYGLLRAAGALDGPAPTRTAPVREWVWAGAVTAPATGLWYPAFTAGDDVTAGQVIGRITDPADGRGSDVAAPATGRVFYGMHGLTVASGAELAAVARPLP